MSDIRLLYKLSLQREYHFIVQCRGENPIPREMFENLLAKLGRASIDNKIKSHPDRPKNPEDELRIKQEIIQQELESCKANLGKCYSCENYLPIKRIRGAGLQDDVQIEQMARILHKLDSQKDICDKVKLSEDDVPLAICPHYQESSDELQSICSDAPQNRYEMWSTLQRKYGEPKIASPVKKPRIR